MGLGDVLLVLHVLGVVGWAGLTTGAYFVLREWRPREVPKSYQMLVHLEAAAGALVFATGVAMAVYLYGFPKSPLWIHWALGIAIVVGLLEVFHVYAVRRWPLERYVRLANRLVPVWAAVLVLMLWLMVAKPF